MVTHVLHVLTASVPCLLLLSPSFISVGFLINSPDKIHKKKKKDRKETNPTTAATKATLFSLYKRNFCAERAKVTSTPLTLMLHGAPQTMLVFSSRITATMAWRVHRFLDMQPSWSPWVEFDIAEISKVRVREENDKQGSLLQ